jgi:hypothetical protein
MADELPVVAGPQAEPAVTPREAPPVTPAVLDGEQRTLLGAILNRIVPANGELPGAGDLDVAASIERTLAVSPALRRLFFDGLVAIQLWSGRLAERDFRDLDPDAQDALLREIEANEPAFFVALVEHAYRGYYTLPIVHRAIGFESRPPQPLGHQLPPFDPSLLEKQRAREPFWRRTE